LNAFKIDSINGSISTTMNGMKKNKVIGNRSLVSSLETFCVSQEWYEHKESDATWHIIPGDSIPLLAMRSSWLPKRASLDKNRKSSR
jgi:hypothetical protein